MDTITLSPEPASLAALHAQDAAHLRALFLGLAELGAGIVRVIAQAVNDHADAPVSAQSQLPALAAAHDQTMRSLRRTALLIQKLTMPAPATDQAAQGLDTSRIPARRRGGDWLDPDAPLDLSKLSDAELDRLERQQSLEAVERPERPEHLERLESVDDRAGRPLVEIIAAVLRDFGVTRLPGEDRYTRPAWSGSGAPRPDAAAPAMPACRATEADRPTDGSQAHATRPDGEGRCRDP